MTKRLWIVIILVSAAWTAGCQPGESAAPAVPSADTEVLEKTETLQETPAETEPNTLPPATAAPSETADAESKETSKTATRPEQNDDIKIQPATESEKVSTSETTSDSDKESPKETDEEPPVTKTQDPPKTEPSTDSEKASVEEADPDNSGKAENGQEPDFKLVAPDLYEKCKYILTTFVDKHGKVDYKNLRRKRSKLIAATRAFSNIEPVEYFQWSRNEKIAFWINAYNILTLNLVIENYPIKPLWWKPLSPPNSIVHIPGAWTKKYFDVMGIEYTLREIEREILLAKFKDPRICFTFSYATLGGALLRNEPYYPDKLDKQLDDQVKKFLASPQGLRIDHQGKTFQLGVIFDWYKSDFIEEYGDIKKFRDRPAPIQAYLNCISKYIPPDDLKYVESKEYEIKFIKYDWRLNEQTNK